MNTVMGQFVRIAAFLGLSTALSGAVDLTSDSKVDFNDVQALMTSVNNGTVKYDARLDFNNDNSIDMKDCLVYGKWVNGFWSRDTGWYAPKRFDNPNDQRIFEKYVVDKKANASISYQVLQFRYPDRSVAAPLHYKRDSVEFYNEINSVFSTPLKPASAFLDTVLKRGVAVFPDKNFRNYYSALDFIHTNDLPILVTSDIILETMYRSYDNILRSMEEHVMVTMLHQVLESSLAYSKKQYSDTTVPPQKQVRSYLQTALDLLDGSLTETMLSPVNPFGREIKVDLTQMQPRGHYTKSEKLKRYFRAMMWLSRSDMSMEIQGSAPLLMKKASLILWDCVVNSGNYPQWITMNSIIEFMVGKSDGLAIRGMAGIVEKAGIVNVKTFVNDFNVSKYDSAVMSGDYGMQTILSEITKDTGSVHTTRLFSFMPQRFILDSYTFSEIVNTDPLPLLPSSLQMAFMLGDNSALKYPGCITGAPLNVLTAQRMLYDSISETGWQENMYMSWMNTLRKLNGAATNPLVSPVFKTAAWRGKMRNTQLTSWAQLRHNTILYAKQSYTVAITCSHPKAYVEPYPQFFDAINTYALRGVKVFTGLDAQVVSYFQSLAEISLKLRDVALRTAQGKEPDSSQVAWLRTIISSYSVGGEGYLPEYKVYDGWYFDLIYETVKEYDLQDAGSQNFVTIADVHSKPADDRENTYKVLHAATGLVELVTTVIKLDTCTAMFVGPVGSYYDYITSSPTDFVRMNDDQWQDTLIRTPNLVNRPEWVKEFR